MASKEAAVTNEMKNLARRVCALSEQLGNAIESLSELGCSVSCDVYFNGGSESITLHQLNGEFEFRVVMAIEIAP